MTYADRVKDTTTTTGTGTITLSNVAPTGYQTFAVGLPASSTVPYCISSQSTAEWEVGNGVLLTSTTLSRSPTASSNAGGLVNFSAGTKDVFCTLPAASLAKLGSVDAAAVTTVPDATTTLLMVVQGGVPKTMTAAAFLAALGTSAGGLSAASALAGSDILTISQDGGTSQVKTTLSALAAFIGVPNTTVPTITGAVVANGAATTLVLTASESLNTAFVPAASAFTVSGHTVSAVAISGATISLTVSAFVNGEAARTIAYTQPGTNNVRDLSGNLLANFTALAITNNVAAAGTPAYLFSPAPVQAPAGGNISGTGYYASSLQIYLQTSAGATPVNANIMWSKSSTVAPCTYNAAAPDVTSPNDRKNSAHIGGWTQGGSPAQAYNGLISADGTLYAWGTAGTWFLWFITNDGFAKPFDNNTGTPIGYTFT